MKPKIRAYSPEYKTLILLSNEFARELRNKPSSVSNYNLTMLIIKCCKLIESLD